MTLGERRKGEREAILRIAAQHGACNVRVAGSLAQSEADEDSDSDFVVQFEPEQSELEHAAFWMELEELLGSKMDVVSERGIEPCISKRVLEEAVPRRALRRSACGLGAIARFERYASRGREAFEQDKVIQVGDPGAAGGEIPWRSSRTVSGCRYAATEALRSCTSIFREVGRGSGQSVGLAEASRA